MLIEIHVHVYDAYIHVCVLCDIFVVILCANKFSLYTLINLSTHRMHYNVQVQYMYNVHVTSTMYMY